LADLEQFCDNLVVAYVLGHPVRKPMLIYCFPYFFSILILLSLLNPRYYDIITLVGS